MTEATPDPSRPHQAPEQRGYDEALRVSEERLALVSRATTDAIWDWDVELETFWWSEGLSLSFGYKLSELEPGPESRISRIHPDDRADVIRDLQHSIGGDVEHWRGEYRFRRSNDDYLTVVDRVLIIRDESKRAVRLIGSLIDVTEPRRLAKRLRQSQTLEAIGQLTSGVAHDFNNLLVVIIGAAESLQISQNVSPDIAELADLIRSAGERGAELTSQLLAFGRQQSLLPKAVHVDDMLVEIGGLLRRTLGADVELQVIKCPVGWNALCDPTQLEAALLNLAVNARHAMPEGGTLSIECHNVSLTGEDPDEHPELEPGDYVMISVTDNGLGMPAHVRERAFEPFFTTKGVGKGSGLGLSMIHGFVRQSNGDVRLHSDLGQGTTVQIFLPRADGGETLPTTTVERDLARGTETIFLVEDDELVRVIATLQLEDLGYTVVAASSGVEALAMLPRMGGFDLLFTDVVMPGGVNGRQLAEQIAIQRPGLKVLYTSGYTFDTIIQQGKLPRDIAILNKPYQKQTLALRIREALDFVP